MRNPSAVKEGGLQFSYLSFPSPPSTYPTPTLPIQLLDSRLSGIRSSGLKSQAPPTSPPPAWAPGKPGAADPAGAAGGALGMLAGVGRARLRAASRKPSPRGGCGRERDGPRRWAYALRGLMPRASQLGAQLAATSAPRRHRLSVLFGCRGEELQPLPRTGCRHCPPGPSQGCRCGLLRGPGPAPQRRAAAAAGRPGVRPPFGDFCALRSPATIS